MAYTTVASFRGIYHSHGNKKLGPGIGVVNRMPGETCPGESEACRKFCYAKKGFYPTKFGRYRAETITLPDKLPEYFRWHTSGDFDSIEYICSVIDVVQQHPDTQFWAYTRSWDVPELVPGLERLRAEPNMELFASVDPSMDSPPEGWHR